MPVFSPSLPHTPTHPPALPCQHPARDFTQLPPRIHHNFGLGFNAFNLSLDFQNLSTSQVSSLFWCARALARSSPLSHRVCVSVCVCVCVSVWRNQYPDFNGTMAGTAKTSKSLFFKEKRGGGGGGNQRNQCSDFTQCPHLTQTMAGTATAIKSVS